ncbi:alpha/beta hydrolase [Mesobacillus foraminis]|uniref:alpha/beta fold hydrolase n=1 Tax=Mesobacillus foraminis TaxID=279826 RepID=UPI0039A3E71C
MPHANINNSLSLFYQIKGEGRPIVFIHPFVMGHNVFKHQERLAEKYQTLFYDLAGHGRSTKGNQPLSIELLAEHLKELLNHINVKKVALCGYSYGGLVAQQFALKYPERTTALILSGGFSEINTLIPKIFIKSVMAMAKHRKMTLAAKLLAKFNSATSQDEKEIFQYARLSDAQRSYEYCIAGLHYKATDALHQLNMPILLVYGSLEKPMHRYRIPFLQAAPQTQVVMINNGTHQLPPRSFLEFNCVIDQFLRTVNEH